MPEIPEFPRLLDDEGKPVDGSTLDDRVRRRIQRIMDESQRKRRDTPVSKRPVCLRDDWWHK